MALLIAVASRDGITIAGHIGKCADWLVFAVDDDGGITEQASVHLEKAMIFHHYNVAQAHHNGSGHPLAGCGAVIGASAGESFITKMRARGFDVAITAEPDPATAVSDYMRKKLAPPRPRPIGSVICKIIDRATNR